METTHPYDRELERRVIGALLVSPARIADVARILDPSDFLQPDHAATYAAIVDLWQDGMQVDVYAVKARQMGGGGLGDIDLLECMSASSGSSALLVQHAGMLAEIHARRRLIIAAGELIEAARSQPDVGKTIDAHLAAIGDVSLPDGQLPATLMPLDDMLDREPADRAPWVIPGLVRRDWRVVIVGAAGSGKSQVLQSVGIAASQGRHPFVPEVRIPAVRVLFVDVENPEERIIEGGRLVREPLRSAGTIDWDRDRLWMWSEQSGIDVRSRKDQGRLEAVLRAVRPDVVCIGPAYKVTVRRAGEDWDEVAIPTMHVLDDMRRRHGFALMMEDHGPHGELRPFGSSMWLRWPEIGLTLTPNDQQRSSRDVGRFRVDRLKNAWPDRLDRGVSLPWVGHWDSGIPESITHAIPRPPHPELEWRDPLEDWPAEPRKDLE